MMTNYYAQPTSIQSLSYGYPAGMGEIPVQADGLGAAQFQSQATAGEEALGVAALASWVVTPWLAGYAARKHGYGWPATVGIFFASNIAFWTAGLLTGGVGGFGVTALAAYYAFED